MQTDFPCNPKFLMNVFESIRDAIILMNPDGNIIYFNDTAEKITGYSREEVLGQPCTILDTDTCVILTESGRQRCCRIL